MKGELLSELQARLAELGRPHRPADVAEVMRELGAVVTDQSLLGALDLLRRHSTGAGLLEDLLKEPGVSDVVVNGPDAVFVDRGRGLVRAELTFPDDESVRRLAIRLAAGAGKRLDDAQPFVDGRLADGTRLHVVLAPLASPGTLISLRVPARLGLSLEQLRESGTLTHLGLEILRGLLRRRVPFLISGGTGSGKTTLLAAMLGELDADQRIVVVEDAAELRPYHPHCVSLEARPANAEGAGAVTLTTLVRQALRMRPDRVVLGEVRGAELIDLLTAFNTGHEGGCATIHANSIHDVPARLEALAGLGGLTPQACHSQVASALRVVLQLRRRGDGHRELAQVGIFTLAAQGAVRITEAVSFEDGIRREAPGFRQLCEMVGMRP